MATKTVPVQSIIGIIMIIILFVVFISCAAYGVYHKSNEEDDNNPKDATSNNLNKNTINYKLTNKSICQYCGYRTAESECPKCGAQIKEKEE